MSIRQITIVGTGLIGGSFGLALRQQDFPGTIVGCDRPEVLEAALIRAAIDRGDTDVRQAVQDCDVVVLATPIGGILSTFEKLAPTLDPNRLITDTGSTKAQFVQRARMVFGTQAGMRVLPGHPMAGKERGGIENANANLFRDAVWLITPINAEPQYTERQREYIRLLESIGARVVAMDPERHDRLCAWISHLPQMIATALACVLRDELGEDEAIRAIGGRALREMTRIASSPYSMWRDIALTNSQNMEEALLRFEQQLAHLRESLRGPGLRQMFESANQFGHGPTQVNEPRGAKETSSTD
jgi:prephenate dehydrogenase